MTVQCKKLLIIPLTVLLTVTLFLNANAKISSNYAETCVTSGSKDVNKTYQLDAIPTNTGGIIQLKVKEGSFKIVNIEEGYLDDKDNFTPTALQHLASNASQLIDNGQYSNPNVRITNSNPLTVNVYSYDNSNDDSDKERVIRITVELAKSDQYCQSREDFDEAAKTNSKRGMFTGYFYIMLTNYNDTTPQEQKNENYNMDACRSIRDGVNYNNKKIKDSTWQHYDSSLKSVYSSSVSFCFNAGNVEYNFDEEQVNSLVEKAIQNEYAKKLAESTKPSTPDFESAFNASYQRAVSQGHTYYNASHEKGIVVSELKCSYKFEDLGEDDDTVGYKYTNLQSYYAQEVENISYEDTKRGKIDVCTRTCEEAVDVEYGPPQAAIAGFCIEYQVKVTSRVKCKSDMKNPTPPSKGTVCQPVPYCVHRTYTATQAGPNEKFDACINECDGGKYSQKCSKKCYNEVYFNNSSTNLINNDDDSGNAKFMASIPTGGKYYRNEPGGEIYWDSKGRGNTYAQWYVDHQYSKTVRDDKANGGKFFADGGGFKRKDEGYTVCNGDCHHINCGPDTYLNDEDARGDYTANMERYNNAIGQCSAAATCHTATATFKISATYRDGANKPHRVDYPLSGGSTLTSKDDSSQRNENRLEGNLLSYNGCYATGSAKNWYQAEWSFPGTWVNNKTGEISFEEKPGNTWHEDKNKFCLPLDAQDVNQKWFNYYMNEKRKKLNSNTTPPTSGSYRDTEYDTNCSEIKDASLPRENEIEYNIKAETEKFGYFEWKFNIACFYAINSNPSENDNSTNCEVSPSNYETKTITTEDLFPTDESSGGKTDTSVNATKIGRSQGFNWTSAATISEYKNPKYAVNPELLIGKIQKAGKTIYDEDKETTYLDYEFDLSPQDLLNIRKDNKSIGSYTNWNGTSRYDEKSKLYIYESSLFRDNGIISKSVKKKALLGCNNQQSENVCSNGTKN